LKKWPKIIGFFSIALGILFYATLTTVNHTPFDQSEYFKSTNQRLDSLAQLTTENEGDTLKVGWAKVNLTPPFQTNLAGYGAGAFESVTDSVWVRVFVFDNQQKQVALIAPDLLIFPPLVKEKLEGKIDELNLDYLFFSATHTHHSIGNWQKGIVGRMFAGTFDENVVDWISGQVILGIDLARKNLKRSKIAFAAISAENLVYNRLVQEMGSVDPWFRLIKIEQDSGQTAVITSFSAHPTNISREVKTIHRDYPGRLTDLLENMNDVDFSAFLAGAMGSQGPGGEGVGEKKVEFIARDAAAQIGLILNVVRPEYTTTLGALSIDVDLREPHFRVSSDLRIRPWLFNLIFTNQSASVDALRIGENILLGTPCDFSGELVSLLDKKARNEGLNLMITSFNGGYVGYITKDDWYDLDAYETRTMNWFGQENGVYFSHIINQMIDITADKNSDTTSIADQ